MSCLAHPDEADTLPCAHCGTAFCDDCLVLLRGERVCGECKQNVVRDLVSGTAVPAQLARVQARAAAYVIDRAMYYALLSGILWTIAWMEKWTRTSIMNKTTAAVLFSVTYAGYFVYEARMLAARGQTLGKMAAKVRVVRRDGSPITRGQAWARASIRTFFIVAWLALSFAPGPYIPEATISLFFLGFADPLVAVFTAQRTAIHDLLVRTRVHRAE